MVYSPISNAGRNKVEGGDGSEDFESDFSTLLTYRTTELIKTMQFFLYSMVMNSQQIGAWATLQKLGRWRCAAGLKTYCCSKSFILMGRKPLSGLFGQPKCGTQCPRVVPFAFSSLSVREDFEN